MGYLPHGVRRNYLLYYHNMKTQNTLVQRMALLFLVATLLAAVGVGCNTAKGFGKDVEKTGEAIQDGAD
jgi:predicted small secreted protein